MNTPPRNPRELRPDLDDTVVKFLLKGVARNPDERFQSAREFREALETLPGKY